MLEPAGESQLDTPPADRLVIRVKLVPQEPPRPSGWQRSSKTALLLTLAAVAVLAGWLGISTFRSESTTSPAAARTEDSAVVDNAPVPQPATETTAPSSAEAIAVEPPVRQPPAALSSNITEVIPDVPASALQTIRGTVRVTVRVSVDEHGTVTDAVADDRGPSRYFERLAVAAAKRWTFTPASSAERRKLLIQFNFTRAGATAHASPPP